MNILPRADEAVIPLEKFTKYALNFDRDKDKAIAFELALGFNLGNVNLLIDSIRLGLRGFPALKKQDSEFGTKYEVVMDITGANNKTAKVLTAWIDDVENGEMRLTSAYVDER